MDLKTLFHNPDELTGHELDILRKKIKLQSSLPLHGALFGGLTMYVVDRYVLKRGYSFLSIGGVAALGFLIGGYGAY